MSIHEKLKSLMCEYFDIRPSEADLWIEKIAGDVYIQNHKMTGIMSVLTPEAQETLLNNTEDHALGDPSYLVEGGIHSSHNMRFSDSSQYDMICRHCMQPDWASRSNPKLAEPCKGSEQ